MNKLNIFFIITLLAVLSCGSFALAAQSPSADAGSDVYISSGQTAILHGSGYDPNGYSLNYYWNCDGGTLSNNNISTPVYTAPYAYQYNNQNVYTCALTVTNSYGYSNSDSVNVYVNYSGNTGNLSAQTNSATNVSNYQATLNGYVSGANYSENIYVWFQWGTGTGYGNETSHQSLYSSGSFSRNISGLNSGATYHFRAVAQRDNGALVYGQDMTFYTTGSGNYYGAGGLIVGKKVINISSGNLSWQNAVSAVPGDILSFAITLQANNQDVHNVFARDNLPQNLIYRGNATANTNLNYLGDPLSGVNIGTLSAGQVYVISYQAQVAGSQSFTYGSTTLNNNATISSLEAGSQTASASVIVNNSLVQGATAISTGATNSFFEDSLLFPLSLILLALWLYFSGRLNRFADWLKAAMQKA